MEFSDQLAVQAEKAGVAISPFIEGKLEAYFRLLAHWNTRINLTSLPLDPPTDHTIDRLFIEPIIAARYLASDPQAWFDFGSGAGSPAIPLKLMRPASRLTLIESKERKAAFLREVVREIALTDTDVQGVRFEEFTDDSERLGVADLVTVRAVRPDASLFLAVRALLRIRGQLLLFGGKATEPDHLRGFELTRSASLLDSGGKLLVLTRTGL